MHQPLVAALVTLCVAARDQECDLTQDAPHMFDEHEDMHCRLKNFTEGFKKGMADSMCMYPKDMVVPLVSEEPDLKYIPGAVMVKRCAGMCNKQLTCVPTETKMTKFSVRRLWEGERRTSCGVVHVEEHVRCKCDCTVMEAHCNKDNQLYSKPECMCKCLNMDHKEQCEQSGRLWDQRTCQCNCKQENTCTTGLFWVPSLCKCVEMKNNELIA